MKKLTFYLFGFLLLSFSVNAQEEPTSLMKEANKAYQEGDFQAASAGYKTLIIGEFSSESLHFNYANSLFKSNEIALAILHYEKALKINPNSDDAAYNLKIANDRTVDKIEMIPELFFYRWWKAIYNLFSADNWAKIMIYMALIGLVGFGAYKYSINLSIRKFGFGLFSSGLVLAFVCWGLAASQKNYANSSSHAIIMNSTVDILSAPSSGSSQLFVLHEGTKVKIEDQTDTWLKVSLPNGNQGWVKINVLAFI